MFFVVYSCMSIEPCIQYYLSLQKTLIIQKFLLSSHLQSATSPNPQIWANIPLFSIPLVLHFLDSHINRIKDYGILQIQLLFLLLNSSLLYECTTICLLIQFEGHLGCFQSLPISKQASVKTRAFCVKISFYFFQIIIQEQDCQIIQ